MKAQRALPSKDFLESSILSCVRETPLLKFGHSGKPAFRNFAITCDLAYITWQSKNKKMSKVAIKDMKELLFGQRTDKFKRHNRPDLDSLSFSIIYDNEGNKDSLDLVTKDENEFQMWTTLLNDLIFNKINAADYITRLNLSSIQPLKMSKKKSDFLEANDVATCGWNTWGNNGHGTNEKDSETNNMRLVEALLGKNVIQISQGWGHACVVLEGGDALSMGSRVGTAQAEDWTLPTPVNTPVPIAAVACGAYHSAAITDTGALLTWGSNCYGELGHGNTLDVTEPKIVQLDSAVVQVKCGQFWSAILSAEGSVFTCGWGGGGALGHRDTSDLSVFTEIVALRGKGIRLVAGGHDHVLALGGSNAMYSWGNNSFGQCAVGHDDALVLSPHLTELPGRAIDISGGVAHTVTIIEVAGKNHVYACGLNNQGQCGVMAPSKLMKLIKIDVTTREKEHVVLQEVKCGAFHTLIRGENGEVYATGANQHGQLGLGTSAPFIPTFTCIDSLRDKNCRALCCGGDNSAVLTARAWVEDSEAKECMGCKALFTFVNRRHHCRNCGGIFCNNCSSKKIAILKIQMTEPQRVCNNCYAMLGGR